MEQYIKKSALVAEINKRIIDAPINNIGHQRVWAYNDVKDIINTLEVKKDDFIVIPYDVRIQYANRESAIKAHAEDYSWNIESELFNQLTKEQQELWRKDIEQACISGGYNGLNLAKDLRYKENLEVKGVDLKKEIDDFMAKEWEGVEEKDEPLYSMIKNDLTDVARHFFELGMAVSNEAQKGE